MEFNWKTHQEATSPLNDLIKRIGFFSELEHNVCIEKQEDL